MKLQTVFLIHGIGDQKPGYSKEWQDNINYYLPPNKVRFVEIYWQDIFTNQNAKKKSLEETQLFHTLSQILSQRIEKEKLSLFPWIKDVLLDFVIYLVNRKLQEEIKLRLKVQILIKHYGKPFTIIAHSWGSVVSYDVLFDLFREDKSVSITNFLTFGSPLWLLKETDNILSIFHYGGARKLRNIENWTNAYAKGDPIGASLGSFDINKDIKVPSVPAVAPHISYFVKKNTYVLKNIIAESLSTSFSKKC